MNKFEQVFSLDAAFGLQHAHFHMKLQKVSLAGARALCVWGWGGGTELWRPCTMRSNASWVIVTWDTPPTRGYMPCFILGKLNFMDCITTRQRSCGNVMFSVMSVWPQGGTLCDYYPLCTGPPMYTTRTTTLCTGPGPPSPYRALAPC